MASRSYYTFPSFPFQSKRKREAEGYPPHPAFNIESKDANSSSSLSKTPYQTTAPNVDYSQPFDPYHPYRGNWTFFCSLPSLLLFIMRNINHLPLCQPSELPEKDGPTRASYSRSWLWVTKTSMPPIPAASRSHFACMTSMSVSNASLLSKQLMDWNEKHGMDLRGLKLGAKVAGHECDDLGWGRWTARVLAEISPMNTVRKSYSASVSWKLSGGSDE